MNNITYCCPSEKINYTGICPVKTCPAFDKRAASGCIYQHLNEISMFSIGNRLKLTNAEIKKSYKRGIKQLTDTAKFYHLSAQAFIPPLSTCKTCGVECKDCINKIRCEARSKFAAKHVNKLPMRILNTPTKIQFWIAVSNKELHEYFPPKVVRKAAKLLSRKTV